jgi:hypothetical protein
MLTPDFFIDAFQSTKKIVFNQVVADKTLQKAATEYVDAQTQFAKIVVHNAISVAKYSVDTITSCWYPKKEQASQAPYKVEPPVEKEAK